MVNHCKTFVDWFGEQPANIRLKVLNDYCSHRASLLNWYSAVRGSFHLINEGFFL